MKYFKKGLLGAVVVASMALIAAEDKTIYVNTFEDEDNVKVKSDCKGGKKCKLYDEDKKKFKKKIK